MNKEEFLDLIRPGVENSSEIDLDILDKAEVRYIIASKIDDEFKPQTENAIMYIKMEDGCISIEGYAPDPYLNTFAVGIDCLEDIVEETTEEDFINLLQSQFDKVIGKIKNL